MRIALLAAGGVTAMVTAVVYTHFSAAVMPRLARLAPAQGISTMQRFNRTAVRPPFMTSFFGAAAVSAWFVYRAAGGPRSLSDLLAGAGGAAYLAGFALTVVYHVPRNNQVDAMDPADPSSWPAWNRYLREWTKGNSVRAVLSDVAVGLFAASAVTGAPAEP